VNFLEARRLVNGFQGGEPLRFTFALSGMAEPFALYLRAAAAQRGRAAEVSFLPFNTLAQTLRADADPAVTEVFLLLPWDFAPEADWRSGLPESVDEERLRLQANETARLLARRPAARLLYLPAPLPPLFPNPARGVAFGRWLGSLALGLGARLLPGDAFALSSYFSSGCPVGGSWIGRVADAVEEEVAPDPGDVGFLGAPAVVAEAEGLAHAVEEFRRPGRRRGGRARGRGLHGANPAESGWQPRP